MRIVDGTEKFICKQFPGNQEADSQAAKSQHSSDADRDNSANSGNSDDGQDNQSDGDAEEPSEPAVKRSKPEMSSQPNKSKAYKKNKHCTNNTLASSSEDEEEIPISKEDLSKMDNIWKVFNKKSKGKGKQHHRSSATNIEYCVAEKVVFLNGLQHNTTLCGQPLLY